MGENREGAWKDPWMICFILKKENLEARWEEEREREGRGIHRGKCFADKGGRGGEGVFWGESAIWDKRNFKQGNPLPSPKWARKNCFLQLSWGGGVLFNTPHTTTIAELKRGGQGGGRRNSE